MQPDPRFWAGKRVCVTGGTGFLGWNLVLQLLPLARGVRIFGLPPANPELRDLLAGMDCVFGDVRDASAVKRAVADCDIVFHTAAMVAVWGPALAVMHSVQSEGTRQVLRALPAHARLVHTSSIVAVGASSDTELLTESSPFNLQRLRVDYVHAKKASEDLVLGAAEKGTDAVVVNPAYLLGPNDYDGSALGRFCRRVWKHKIPLIPPGGWNLVDVRDAAIGHLLAAERGSAGRRYILGGENLSMADFVQLLTEVRGRPSRWSMPMPGWLLSTLARVAAVWAWFSKKEPYPALQHVRLNRYRWYFSSERAAEELSYRPRPIRATLVDTLCWMNEHGILHHAVGTHRWSGAAAKSAA